MPSLQLTAPTMPVRTVYLTGMGILQEVINIVFRFADNETFPQERFEQPVPSSVERLCSRTTIIFGSSHGLLCLHGFEDNPRCTLLRTFAVIWNPSIRKSVTVNMLGMRGGTITTVLGFGVCPGAAEIKLDNIICNNFSFGSYIFFPCDWSVSIYSLTSGWTNLDGNMPRKSITVTWSQAVVDRFIYCHAFDNIAKDDGFQSYSLIVSFGMTADEFREVSLLDSLALQQDLSLFKLRDSLAVLEYTMTWPKQVCSVWEMKHGVQTSFANLFNIEEPVACIKTVLGFRNSGKPVMLVGDLNSDQDVDSMSALVVYEPGSECIKDFGIYGLKNSLSVNSYMEKLLLLKVPQS